MSNNNNSNFSRRKLEITLKDMSDKVVTLQAFVESLSAVWFDVRKACETLMENSPSD